MLLFYIFFKKEGSNPFLSNGRVNIFSLESRKFFVKKQPHHLTASPQKIITQRPFLANSTTGPSASATPKAFASNSGPTKTDM